MTTRHIADACALIVFLTEPEPERVMRDGALIMRSAQVRVSSVTVWEITRKAALGKLPLSWRGHPSFSQLLRVHGFVPHPLAWEDAEAANKLPPLHRDPMDRMLIASAMRAGLAVITNDPQFPAYGVETVW